MSTALIGRRAPLTRHRACVFPVFIQGEVYASSYFEDVFSGKPVGYRNVVEDFWYDVDGFVEAKPDSSYFLAVQSLNCSAPP